MLSCIELSVSSLRQFLATLAGPGDGQVLMRPETVRAQGVGTSRLVMEMSGNDSIEERNAADFTSLI